MAVVPTDNIIIIKKVVKGGHGHHGGGWKVAFADFVTAMMALFIVLWVLAQSDKTKKAVSLYFTEPNLTPEEIKMRLEHPALPSSPIKMKPTKDAKSKSSAHSEESKNLKNLAHKILVRLSGLKWFQSMKGQLLIELTEEGLRIEFLENEKSPFFDVGSATPRSYTREALDTMAQEIKGVPNQVAIEGHTDSRPYQATNYSNWELSADRANAARRILEGAGVHRIAEVRGLADVRLRTPGKPFDHSNRRVSLVVRYVNPKPPVEKFAVPKAPEAEGTPAPDQEATKAPEETPKGAEEAHQPAAPAAAPEGQGHH